MRYYSHYGNLLGYGTHAYKCLQIFPFISSLFGDDLWTKYDNFIFKLNIKSFELKKEMTLITKKIIL